MNKDETANSNKSGIENMGIKDFTITDEFIQVDRRVPCPELAKQLLNVPKGVIFAMNEDQVPVGAITAREFLIAVMEGKDLSKLKAEDLMNTNIMEIDIDDALSEVVLKISKYTPYAVAVRDTDGKFKGYFSPKDYQQALKRTGVL